MSQGDLGPLFRPRYGPEGSHGIDLTAPGTTQVLETTVSPFHCLYQDALWFHTQSHLRLKRSESEASRQARAAFLLYLSAAESLVHHAAFELGRPELKHLVLDPDRPLSLSAAWRLLPSISTDGESGFLDLESPPWPQFEELLELRRQWAYPGPAEHRRAYYKPSADGTSFEPVEPHEVPDGLGVTESSLFLPRTGLPRDPYAIRPHHLDTARGVLDAAIAGLDRRLGGALTRDARHRKEPIRFLTIEPSEATVPFSTVAHRAGRTAP